MNKAYNGQPIFENLSERDNYYFLKGSARGAEKMKAACVLAAQKVYDEYLKNHRLSMSGCDEPLDLQSARYLKKIIIAVDAVEV